VILSVEYGPSDQADPSSFVRWAGNLSHGGEEHAGGAVFDLVTGGPPSSLADTLDRLEALLKKPEAAPAPRLK